MKEAKFGLGNILGNILHFWDQKSGAPRFPYERSQWRGDQNDDPRKRWYEALERMGTSAVHMRLMQQHGPSAFAMSLGTEPYLVKGFAEEWLAWHDQQRINRESTQIFWTRWAAWAASAAVGITAIGWLITLLLKK